jgi:hypothetical protein
VSGLRTCTTGGRIQGYTVRHDGRCWRVGHVVDGRYCCDVEDGWDDEVAARESAACMRRTLIARRKARKAIRKALAGLSTAYSVLIRSDSAWDRETAGHALAAHSEALTVQTRVR